ncbi:MAG: dienelactone hydrolase family protein [Deltaproteobacteria bacterium]|nr:dienelactone hydrolase family protein [Deltaproteobacteria bacterium]
MAESGENRLEAVVGHWLPRMTVAGLTAPEIQRLIEETRHWSNWCATWSAEGERQVSLADEARRAGRLYTAGEGYQRAALYFHFAQFMFFEDPVQKEAAARRKVEVFAQAAPLLQPAAQARTIPLEPEALRGYLRLPSQTPAPVVILVPGSDSTKEEFPALEAHFLKRGLATFSFDGPGQGEGRRLGVLTPSWQPTLKAVANTLRAEPKLNGRIGVMGMAFGGHLVLQGAAGIPGLEALVCMNGFYDLGAFWEALPAVYRDNMRHTLGGGNSQETQRRAAGFSLRNLTPPQCPTLVVHGARDRIFPLEDARRIVPFVGAKAEAVEYPEGNHVCNNIAWRYRPLIADWMAERLGGQVSPA